MNRPGILEFKCRRCGGLERSTPAPDVPTAVNEMMLYGKIVTYGVLAPVRNITTHICPDDGIGLADFVGGSVT